MKYDLISIGTVSIDLYYKGKDLTYSDNRFELAVGGKYFADYFYESLGGGATNVAIGAKKSGISTALLAKMGNNPFKKFIHEKLDDSGVIHKDFCQYADDYMNISSILLTEQGEKTILNYRSKHQHFFECEDDLAQITKGRAIYLANLPNVSITERVNILRYAKQHELMTFTNLGVVDCRRPKEQLDDYLKKTDVLIINGHEFADLVKVDYKNIDFKQNIVTKYFQEFLEKILVVTDGENGSYAYHKAMTHFQHAIAPRTIVDSTGAGDGYTAGFIAEYLTTKDIDRAMQTGAEYAAKILGKIGAN